MNPCCSFCVEKNVYPVILNMEAQSPDGGDDLRNKNDDERFNMTCRTLHVGSIPCSASSSLLIEYNHSNNYNGIKQQIEVDDTFNYSVEMTLRDFQQFLEEGKCWYNNQRTLGTTGRNWSRSMMFDPCNALGAEVSLGDFLMHNHNNIDIKPHDAIHSEEIQTSDNRRSAVLVIMERRQQLLDDDELNSSLEVQPIHTFDDLTPPNLMNASFDLRNDGDDDDDVVTFDMNESYSEEPFDDDDDDDCDDLAATTGSWWNNSDQVAEHNDRTVWRASSFTTTPSSAGIIAVAAQHSYDTTTLRWTSESRDGSDDESSLDRNNDVCTNVDQNGDECEHVTDHRPIHGVNRINRSTDDIDLVEFNNSPALQFLPVNVDGINGFALNTTSSRTKKHMVVAKHFVSLFALQILVLAGAYFLRCLSDHSNTGGSILNGMKFKLVQKI